MTALELFTTLRECGVVLTPTCDYGDVPPGGTPSVCRPLVFGLHVDAPKGVLTDALRTALRTHKAALLDLLEVFEERAALIEYDGGIPRGEAERLAWVCLRGETRPLPTAVVT